MKKQTKTPVLPVQFPVIKSGITSAGKLQNVLDQFIHELLGNFEGQVPATITQMDDSLYVTSEIGDVNLCIGITSRRTQA